MASIRQLFWELKAEAFKIALFRSFLNGVIIFLAFNISFSFFSISWKYALVIAGFGFLMNLYIHYHRITLAAIEKNNPEVNEMLSTMKDNISTDNVMTRALALEVLGKAKNISSGNLMEYNKLVTKIVTIGILSLAMVILASFQIQFNELEIPLADLGLKDVRFGGGGDGPVTLNDTYLLDDSSIYGDADTIALGNEQLDLNIQPSLSEVDLSQEKDLEDLNLNRNSYPTEVGVVGAAASGSSRVDEVDLVNAYYLKKTNRN